MSRYRYWWRPAVVKAIQAYPDLRGRSDLAPLEAKIVEAVDAAFLRAGAMRGGEGVRKAAASVLVERRYTVDGYAAAAHWGAKTVTRQLTTFINLVAEELGLLRAGNVHEGGGA